MEAEILKLIEIERKVLKSIEHQKKKLKKRREALGGQNKRKLTHALRSAIADCTISIFDLKKLTKKTTENVERLKGQHDKYSYKRQLQEAMGEAKKYLQEKQRFEGELEYSEREQIRKENEMLREKVAWYERSIEEDEKREKMELAAKVAVAQSSVKDDFGAKLMAKESHKRTDVFFFALEALRRSKEKFEIEAGQLEALEKTLERCKELAKTKSFKYLEDKMLTCELEIRVKKEIKEKTEKKLNKGLKVLERLEGDELSSEHKEQEELQQILLELVFDRNERNEKAHEGCASCFWDRLVKQYFHEHVLGDEKVNNLSAMLSKTDFSNKHSFKSNSDETLEKQNGSHKDDQSTLSQIEQMLKVPMEQRKVIFKMFCIKCMYFI